MDRNFCAKNTICNEFRVVHAAERLETFRHADDFALFCQKVRKPAFCAQKIFAGKRCKWVDYCGSWAIGANTRGREQKNAAETRCPH
jgi:hypothetical protein